MGETVEIGLGAMEPPCGREHAIFLPAMESDSAELESREVWGFRDSAFVVNDKGCVSFTGDRYPISGQEMPLLLPWMGTTLSIDLNPNDLLQRQYPPRIPISDISENLYRSLIEVVGEPYVSADPEVRLRHGHGHTQEEMFAIKHSAIERVPDVVVWPSTDSAILEIIELAKRYGACVVPFGGGTNVTDALKCPISEDRSIISIDMRRMNRINWIDPINRMACIDAGAVGRHIQSQLAAHGFTMGHEPDSIEFSTLGGWIATHASGMKRNRYGNIEDLILEVQAVTSDGLFEQQSISPRKSIGIDPKLWFLGSEGNLGIITRAIVKIFPAPEVQRYASVIFQDFATGVSFLRDLRDSSNLPASVRLVDNLQFQFSQTLKPQSRGFLSLKSKFEKWYVTRAKGFSPEEMVVCTLVYEGSEKEVRSQKSLVHSIARKYQGISAGEDNGRRGYQLTFSIAYIRDFAMDHWILAESFETSVPWSKLLQLYNNVKQRLYNEHRKKNLPGRPFITCRVTQIYETGVCLYFYFAFYFKGVNHPSRVYAELESAARDEILRNGGSLSHHHGIGKIRSHFLPQVLSHANLVWRKRVKLAVDPDNLFGSGNQKLQ